MPSSWGSCSWGCSSWNPESSPPCWFSSEICCSEPCQSFAGGSTGQISVIWPGVLPNSARPWQDPWCAPTPDWLSPPPPVPPASPVQPPRWSRRWHPPPQVCSHLWRSCQGFPGPAGGGWGQQGPNHPRWLGSRPWQMQGVCQVGLHLESARRPKDSW